MAFDNLAPAPRVANDPGFQYGESALAKSREAAQHCRVQFDIAYGPDAFQKLDLYAPKERPATAVPVLVFVHGGGFVAGHKEWNGFTAAALVDTPAIVVSPDYRLAPTHRFPAGLEDVIAALSWVHKNIAGLGGDPARVFVGGHSAGAHLTAIAALRRDLLLAAGLPEAFIKGCFPVSGPLHSVYKNHQPGSGEERFYKTVLAEESDEAARRASPLAFVEGNRTPFLVAWGEKDFERIIRGNTEMVAALRRQPGRVMHWIMDDCDHFDTHLRLHDADQPWTGVVRDWMSM